MANGSKASRWVKLVEIAATAAITSYDAVDGVGPYQVVKVKYEAGAGVGPDERCGTLCIDAANWQVTAEAWPRPRQPNEPRNPVGEAASIPVTVKYISCATPMSSTGAPVNAEVGAAEQLAMMDLAWHVYRRLLVAETDWAKNRGPHLGDGPTGGIARVGVMTRLPVQAGGAGFQTTVTCKLGTDC